MRQAKLSKKLTLGYKFTAILFTFCLSLTGYHAQAFLGLGNSTPEMCNTLPTSNADEDAKEIWNKTCNPDYKPDEPASCEDKSNNLNSKLMELKQTCSNIGIDSNECLPTVFQCISNEAASEDCEKLQGQMASTNSQKNQKASLENEQDILEELKDQQKDVTEEIDKYQEQVDSIKDDLNELDKEQNDLNAALKEKLQLNEANRQTKAAEYQAQIEAKQAESRQLTNRIFEYKKEINKLVTKYQLQCNKEAKEKAQAFYEHFRKARLRGRISSRTLYQYAKLSNSEAAALYQRRQRRKCMRLDANTDFGQMYRSLITDINNDKQLMANNQREIEIAQNRLINEIRNTAALKNLADSNDALAHAEKNKEITKLIAQKQQDAQWRAQKIAELTASSKSLQDKISSQAEKVSEARKAMIGAASEDDLKNMRKAYLGANDLISQAEDAVKGASSCDCHGTAFKTISNYSGSDFCPADDPIEDDPVSAIQ